MSKLLTIITICYNEPHLERTCESIVNQTRQDFEWVVIDGGSNKKTQEIWDKYKYRIDKFISEKDSGLYNAMNKGIKVATGEYLEFMNAGDIFYDNDVLKNVIPYLSAGTDILYGNCAVLPKKRKKWIVKKPFTDLFSGFAAGHTIYHQASFLKKDLFYLYGLYDESFRIAADYDGFVKFFIKKAKFTYIDRAICNFDSTGISSRNRELAKRESTIVQNKYFTPKEIQEAYEKYDKSTIGYTFLEKLFSIKKSSDRIHKIITLFNIHVKFKIKKTKQERKNKQCMNI